MGNRITIVIGGARAETLQVDTVEAALRLAGDGDSIILEEGSYSLDSPVSIVRNVFVQGLGRGAVLNGSTTVSPLVEWRAPGGQLARMTIVQQSANPGQARNHAFQVSMGNPIIKSCTFHSLSQADAVKVSGSSSPAFVSCRVANTRGNGMHLEGESKAKLLQCEFLENFHCLDVRGRAAPELTSCLIAKSKGVGVRVLEDARITMLACRIIHTHGTALNYIDQSKVNLIDCEVL